MRRPHIIFAATFYLSMSYAYFHFIPLWYISFCAPYNDTSYDMSQIDCGLLGENMILSAWSMGIGSCCLGSPIRFMKTEPQVADYLKRLNIPEGYELLYCIAFGYPDESPAAKPRDASKVMFVE